MRAGIFILISFISVRLSGQDFEPGKLNSDGDDKFFYKMIGEDKNGFYSLRFNFTNKGKEFYIVQYNRSTLNKIRTISIGRYEMEDEIGRTVEIVRDFTKVMTKIFLYENKIYLFSKLFNPPEKSVQLNVDIYSATNGENLVYDSVVYNIHSYKYDIYERKYHLSLSPDSTKLLCASLSSLSDDNQIVNATLFKMDDLSKIWDKELMSEYNGQTINIKGNEYTVDLQDNLYYSFSIVKNTKNPDESAGGIACFGKNEKKEKVKIFHTQSDILQYNSAISYVKSENSIYFTSNFKDSKKIKERDAGIIVLKFLINDKLEFQGDTVYFSGRNKKVIECDSVSTSVTKYSFSPVKLKNINGMNFLYTYMDYYELREGRSYHGSDMIFVFKLKENGKIEWQNLLPRSTFFKYVVTNFDLTGMSVYEREGRLNFLFTEDISNLKWKDTYCDLKPTGYLSNTNLVELSIDPRGEVTKKVIYVNNKNCILPSSVEILTDKQTRIFRYRNGEKEGFGKIKFAD